MLYNSMITLLRKILQRITFNIFCYDLEQYIVSSKAQMS